MDNSQVVFARLNDYITRRMWEEQIPGLVLALTDRERTAYVTVFGYADVATGSPVKLDTLFRVGGLSKCFTAIALLQLVETGLVDLHVPITRYLPWFSIRSASDAPITLHHLLSHTGGIGNGPGVSLSARFEIAALHDCQAAAAPGAAYHYSNLGYRILGVILEEMLGQSYASIIQSRLLDPLAMGRSAPVITQKIRDRMAQGYAPYYDDRPRSPTEPVAATPWMESDTADGSIATTASDLAAFLRVLLNRGRADVLSAANFNLMTRPVIQTDQPDMFYGYGLMINQLDDNLHVRHGGSVVGYSAAMLGDVDSGIGVVILANKRDCEFWDVAEYAVRTLREARKRHDLPAVPPDSEPYLVANAADYAGEYTSAGRHFTLIAEDNGLLLKYQDEYIFLERRGPDEFYVNFEGFRYFLLSFGREAKKGWPGQVIEAFYGAEHFLREGYDAPTAFDYPPEWDAYPGHYRSHDPEMSNFRVIMRKDQLVMIYPTTGESVVLTPLDDNGVFLVGEDRNSPECIAFDTIVSGKAYRAHFNLSAYHRFFTP